MARLAAGDRGAFEPLYAALRPRALGLCRRYVGDAEAADIAQSALLKVFARASEFAAGRPCLPWFYAIVANELRASKRQRARLSLEADPAGATPAAEAPADEQLLARELERALALALDALDASSAEAINAVLGRAPLPGVAPATFRKRVSRAYAKLRLLLGGQDAR